MMLRRLTLATTAVLPSYSTAFAYISGRAPVIHCHSTFLSPYVRRSTTVAFFSSSQGGRRGGSGVEETSRTPSSRMKGNMKKFQMSAITGVEQVVPVLGGAEAAAAAIVGHIPGVFVGLGTVIWSTIVKERLNSAPESILKPVAGGIGYVLTFLTVVMLGVRIFTAQPDSRYINDFPINIAHPEGCTRVAAEGGNKGIAVPMFTSNVDEVQVTVKDWMESQPRTTIETEQPGYLHAKCLTLLFGFPDSLGVKIFKNDSGKTEIWVQSELRVGQGDLGVNYRRVENLLGYLGMKLS